MTESRLTWRAILSRVWLSLVLLGVGILVAYGVWSNPLGAMLAVGFLLFLAAIIVSIEFFDERKKS